VSPLYVIAPESGVLFLFDNDIMANHHTQTSLPYKTINGQSSYPRKDILPEKPGMIPMLERKISTTFFAE
jgi:hypothetical protein